MANAKIQPFTILDQSKHHCYTLSTTCTLFKLASEVGPRTTFSKRGYDINILNGLRVNERTRFVMDRQTDI